jgi:hypothetical protein
VSVAAAAFATLVHNLLRAADAMIDAGQNDPLDPWLRLKDFGGRERVLVEAPNAGVLAAPLDALPAGHPARALDPVPCEYGPRWVALGRDGQTRWRLSTVRNRTAQARSLALARIDQLERIAESERRRAEREERERPDAQKRRVEELEAEVAKLKAAG